MNAPRLLLDGGAPHLHQWFRSGGRLAKEQVHGVEQQKVTVANNACEGGFEIMEMRQAYVLRSQWGDKPCLHPRFEVQFYQGMPTGDYVCTTCGREFSKQEVRALRSARKAIKQVQDTRPKEGG